MDLTEDLKDIIGDKIINFSDEQNHAVSFLKNKNIFINAVAGSGKTTTSINISQKFNKKSILLLTYNAKLKIETRKKINDFGLENLEVHSFHSFCVKYYDSKTFKDEKIISIYQNDTKMKSLFTYDIIIIDEAQDLNLIYYNLIKKIYKDCNNKDLKYCIIGDTNQTIYKYSGSDERFLLFSSKIFNNGIEWEKCDLKNSFRMSKEATKFINNCMMGYDKINSKKKGERINYVICNTFWDYPYEIFMKLLEKYKPEDIFILGPSLKSPNTPIRKLENKIKINHPSIDIHIGDGKDKNDKDFLKNKLLFTTFHQAKGLERKAVIVFGFDKSYFDYYKKNSSPFLCPNELYVAATRGIEKTYLFHHSQNNYLPFLDKENIKKNANLFEINKLCIKEISECNTRNITTGDYTSHLSSQIVLNSKKFFSIIDNGKSLNKIKIIDKINNGGIYEDVSRINDMVMLIYYEYIITGKISNIEYIHNNENITYHTSENDKNGIDSEDYEKSSGKRNFKISQIKENIKNKTLDVSDIETFIYLAIRYISFYEGYLNKIKQIQDYTWLNKNILSECIENIKEFKLTDNPSFFVNSNIKIKNINMETLFHVIDENNIYFFGSKDFTDEETIKLALDALIWEYRVKITNKDNWKEYERNYYYLNYISGQSYKLLYTYEELEKLFNYLYCVKYEAKVMLSDSEFLDIMSKGEENNTTDEEKIIVLDIETNDSLIVEISYEIIDYNFNVLLQKTLIINNGNCEVDFFKRYTPEFIKEKGITPIEALLILKKDIKNIKYICGHNVKTFDMNRIRTACTLNKINIKFPNLIIDTMKISKGIVKCYNVKGDIKYPKLEELYKHFYKELPDEKKQHTGCYDVEITRKSLYQLVVNNHYSIN